MNLVSIKSRHIRVQHIKISTHYGLSAINTISLNFTLFLHTSILDMPHFKIHNSNNIPPNEEIFCRMNVETIKDISVLCTLPKSK